LYSVGANPFVYVFLLAQALLLAGNARRIFNAARSAQPAAQMQAGGLVIPAVFFLFGVGLMPQTSEPLALVLWPIAVVAAIAAAAFWLSARSLRLLPPHLTLPRLPLRAWGAQLLRGGVYALDLVTGLLEGEAGVIWALLLIALLVSFIGGTFAG
jgi:hypothetical protein